MHLITVLVPANADRISTPLSKINDDHETYTQMTQQGTKNTNKNTKYKRGISGILQGYKLEEPKMALFDKLASAHYLNNSIGSLH